jgi:hypothetical protein
MPEWMRRAWQSFPCLLGGGLPISSSFSPVGLDADLCRLPRAMTPFVHPFGTPRMRTAGGPDVGDVSSRTASGCPWSGFSDLGKHEPQSTVVFFLLMPRAPGLRISIAQACDSTPSALPVITAAERTIESCGLQTLKGDCSDDAANKYTPHPPPPPGRHTQRN